MLIDYLAGRVDTGEMLAWLIAVVVAITVHEFGHAKSAEIAGDPTPRAMGRISLNPLAHYDPIGTTLFLFAGFGWAKPVPINPLTFHHPRRDVVLVSLWGPLSNFVLAALLALPIRLHLTGAYTMPVLVMIYANLLLGFFNLIPIGPLDGAHALEGLLSDRARLRLYSFYARYQGAMLLALVIILAVRPISAVVFGFILIPVRFLLSLLVGGGGGL